MVASFYHPVANKRLEELREGRMGVTGSPDVAGPNPEEMSESIPIKEEEKFAQIGALSRSESSFRF